MLKLLSTNLSFSIIPKPRLLNLFGGFSCKDDLFLRESFLYENDTKAKHVIFIKEKRTFNDSKLNVIRKSSLSFFGDNIKLHSAVIVAGILDPELWIIHQEVSENIDLSYKDFFNKLISWAKDNIQHTQKLSVFKDLPGKDPWGEENGKAVGMDLFPVYRKLLPSEMRAMQIYSGKITGKCISICHLLMGLLLKAGMASENIIALRRERHAFVLAKIDKDYFILNSEVIYPLNESNMKWLFSKKKPYLALYNDKYYFCKKYFFLNKSILDNQDLITSIKGNIKLDIQTQQSGQTFSYAKRKDFEKLIFSKENQENPFMVLIKYAYQSLYVPDLNYYLRISVDSPLTKKLAQKFDSIEKMIEWIKANIRLGSIFRDSKERIMISDQVIVFRLGSFKDQALLFAALLVNKGYNPKLRFTSNKAFVEVNQTTYNIKTWWN
ncbi:hypothetical protein ACFLZV_06965 [Candidatus Margulisiibacteriota bacterium]